MITFQKAVWVAVALSATLVAEPSLLRPADLRHTVKEMLGYHVEYKDFTPILMRRTVKLYFDQFDSDRIYLLAGEVKPFLDYRDEELTSIIEQVRREDLSPFVSMNQVIQRGIARARQWRKEIGDALIKGEALPTGTDPDHGYAASEEQLKFRLTRLLIRMVDSEKASTTSSTWGPAQIQKALTLWEKRFQRTETAYLATDEKRSTHYLVLHVLKSMAKSLDAHTSYFSPEEAYEMRAQLEKQFEGIGVVLREGIDGVFISDLVKGGPAERSGQIAVGDLIIEIDGKKVEGSGYEEVLLHMKGSGKKQLTLGLKRPLASGEAKVYRIDLTREKIVMQDDRLSYEMEPYADGIIGKITLPSFYESSGSTSCEFDMREAIRDLKKRGKLYGIVLDMRENSGGFLNQAVKVGGLFISSGVIVISKYAHGQIQYLRDLDARIYFGGPMVILTSRASASAAEIVAQALQDYGTAVIVGDERTYGKGTIQYQTVTDDGAKAFFKVTVGRYYTVSGRSTQIEGVLADIHVPTIYSAYNIGERYLEYPLTSDRIPSAYIDPLSDIDKRNHPWFQKNYIPHLQKKLSTWNQMLPQLKTNSSRRIAQDKDFQTFLLAIKSTPPAKEAWGTEDLQMGEGLRILKDMIYLNASGP